MSSRFSKVALSAAIGLGLLALSATASAARPKEKAPQAWGVFSGFAGGNDLVRIAKAEIGKGAVYGRRTKWCGTFMNWVLQKSGRQGSGSDQARSFASIGTRINGPQVGAIAVMNHHVGVVSGIDPNGNPILISGNHNRRVGEGTYPRKRVIAFVVP